MASEFFAETWSVEASCYHRRDLTLGEAPDSCSLLTRGADDALHANVPSGAPYLEDVFVPQVSPTSDLGHLNPSISVVVHIPSLSSNHEPPIIVWPVLEQMDDQFMHKLRMRGVETPFNLGEDSPPPVSLEDRDVDVEGVEDSPPASLSADEASSKADVLEDFPPAASPSTDENSDVEVVDDSPPASLSADETSKADVQEVEDFPPAASPSTDENSDVEEKEESSEEDLDSEADHEGFRLALLENSAENICRFFEEPPAGLVCVDPKVVTPRRLQGAGLDTPPVSAATATKIPTDVSMANAVKDLTVGTIQNPGGTTSRGLAEFASSASMTPRVTESPPFYGFTEVAMENQAEESPEEVPGMQGEVSMESSDEAVALMEPHTPKRSVRSKRAPARWIDDCDWELWPEAYNPTLASKDPSKEPQPGSPGQWRVQVVAPENKGSEDSESSSLSDEPPRLKRADISDSDGDSEPRAKKKRSSGSETSDCSLPQLEYMGSIPRAPPPLPQTSQRVVIKLTRLPPTMLDKYQNLGKITKKQTKTKKQNVVVKTPSPSAPVSRELRVQLTRLAPSVLAKYQSPQDQTTKVHSPASKEHDKPTNKQTIPKKKSNATENKCDKCMHVFSSRYSLKRHCEKRMNCRTSEGCVQPVLLTTRMMKQFSKEHKQCKRKKSDHSTTNPLQQQKNTTGKDSKYCFKCSKIFSSNYNLWVHLKKIHLAACCKYCSFASLKIRAVERHIRETHVTCESHEACESEECLATKVKQGVIKKVVELKKFCDICNKNLVWNIELWEHLRRYHKRPRCTLCAFASASESTMERHVLHRHFDEIRDNALKQQIPSRGEVQASRFTLGEPEQTGHTTAETEQQPGMEPAVDMDQFYPTPPGSEGTEFTESLEQGEMLENSEPSGSEDTENIQDEIDGESFISELDDESLDQSEILEDSDYAESEMGNFQDEMADGSSVCESDETEQAETWENSDHAESEETENFQGEMADGSSMCESDETEQAETSEKSEPSGSETENIQDEINNAESFMSEPEESVQGEVSEDTEQLLLEEREKTGNIIQDEMGAEPCVSASEKPSERAEMLKVEQPPSEPEEPEILNDKTDSDNFMSDSDEQAEFSGRIQQLYQTLDEDAEMMPEQTGQADLIPVEHQTPETRCHLAADVLRQPRRVCSACEGAFDDEAQLIEHTLCVPRVPLDSTLKCPYAGCEYQTPVQQLLIGHMCFEHPMTNQRV